MAAPETIEVEVAYARPDRQVIIPVHVAADATVQDVIESSGILRQFPEIDLSHNKVGVFGKLSRLTAGVRPGDRIEIYRQLIADPKEVRRQQAMKEKQARQRAATDTTEQDSGQ